MGRFFIFYYVFSLLAGGEGVNTPSLSATVG